MTQTQVQRSMINKLFAFLFLGMSVGAGCGFAQTPASAAFEVASVKSGDPSSHQMMLRMGSARFTAQNVPLKMLIQYAYGLKSDDQLSGGPGWLGSKTFDIDAKQDDAQAAEFQKLPQDKRSAQVQAMLQGLLAERFKLQISRQTKELPIYALVVAKGGVKMKPAIAAPTAVPVSSDGAPVKRPGRMTMSGRGQVTGEEVPVSVLADILSRQPETEGRVVVDKTGLTGNYSFALKWTPESGAPAMGGSGGGGAPPPADDAGPSFFTALQEQLGLKLESQKGPVEVLVVEHAEEPSAN
jgi:uncharacterized protein (TIGR03435 family)